MALFRLSLSLMVVAKVSAIGEQAKTCSGESCKCKGRAQYKVEFTGKWTKPGDYELAFPGDPTGTEGMDAHWSPLVGATFSEGGNFWFPANAASWGVKVLAETGEPTTLLRELSSNMGTYLSAAHAPGPVWAPYEMEITVTADQNHPYLGLITMLAPTTDWISGASAIPLCGEDGWRDEFYMELKAYDAGTCDGTSFAMCSSATVPQEKVAVLKCGNGVFCDGDGEVDEIATVTVTRVV